MLKVIDMDSGNEGYADRDTIALSTHNHPKKRRNS
jgi:hypothetical protein